MSYIYVVGFGDTGRVKVGYSGRSPERRVEAHKRGARAYLECTEFQEWISIDHEEGVENEKALIAWCRERTGTVTGEYFTLPYSEVLEYAQSLPMTPATDTVERPLITGEWQLKMAQALAQASADAARYSILERMLGKETLRPLIDLLDSERPLPEPGFSIANADITPPEIDALRQHQAEYGLGLSLLDLTAGTAMTSIHTALLNRVHEIQEAGRHDLLDELPNHRIEEVLTPLEYVLWSSWYSLNLIEYIEDAIHNDPEGAEEVLDALKGSLIGQAENTLRKVRQSVDRYPDGSPVRVIREDARVYNYKVRLPWETADPDETFGPAEPALEVVR